MLDQAPVWPEAPARARARGLVRDLAVAKGLVMPLPSLRRRPLKDSSRSRHRDHSHSHNSRSHLLCNNRHHSRRGRRSSLLPSSTSKAGRPPHLPSDHYQR